MKKLVNPYRAEFRDIFARQKKILRKCLGKKPRVEHFGSTAVPGLPGKGIVDILIAFKRKSQISAAAKKLASAGYFLSRKGQAARGDRVFLSSRKNESAVGDVHLHLVLEDSEDFKGVLRFRDRLRRNKMLRARYVKIKKEAAVGARGKRERYAKLKSTFIDEASNPR
jgi:GrpB-like predicted nucleotidyltransferase (UPF0157 family)